MSDIFAPPPPEPQTRTKPPLCAADGPQGSRCSLYREHASEEHVDQHKHVRWLVRDTLPEPTRWHHSRKGYITGHLVGLDETWARIRLVGDHDLRMKADGHRPDGEEITVRRSFLHPEPTDLDVIW